MQTISQGFVFPSFLTSPASLSNAEVDEPSHRYCHLSQSQLLVLLLNMNCMPHALKLSTEAMLATVASLLQEICDHNDKGLSPAEISARGTRFHSIAMPNISIHEYLVRARRYATCSDACFVAALVYLDVAQHRSPLVVDSLSVHRLFITSLLLAAKYLEDRCQPNSIYAQIGGLSATEINQLEVEFLNSMHFFLDIDVEHFRVYENALLARFTRESYVHSYPGAPTPISIPTPHYPMMFQYSMNTVTVTSATATNASIAAAATGMPRSDSYTSIFSESQVSSICSPSGSETSSTVDMDADVSRCTSPNSSGSPRLSSRANVKTESKWPWMIDVLENHISSLHVVTPQVV